MTTIKVVLLPVFSGLFANTFVLPRLPKALLKLLDYVTPPLSAIFVALVCGKVVATNSVMIRNGGLQIVFAVICLHTLGFFFGYKACRLLKLDKRTARTVSIETGMQNSALASVLATQALPQLPQAAIPGAVSAICHSLIGSVAAWKWKQEDKREKHLSLS